MFVVSLAAGLSAAGVDTVRYSARFEAWHGSSPFAPHLMSAGRFGDLNMSSGATVSASVIKRIDAGRRFDYGFGAELSGGWESAADYARYDAGDDRWLQSPHHPSRVMLRQLYGEIKWRSLFLSVGLRKTGSALLDDSMSSGDMVVSANAAPVPEARVGFLDFVDVPLTRGALQIEGVVAYGRFADDGWWRSHSNLYDGHVATGVWYLYRRLYLRTDPSRRLSVTFGAQSAAQFGGETTYYEQGKVGRTDHRGLRFVDFFKAFWPSDASGEDFAFGNTLGSWDLKARYTLGNGMELSAYFQLPWEDGSGLAKCNGWDGLYGVSLSMPGRIVSGVTAEYLDLTNQSGPIHWAPGDYPGTTVTGEATGADNYYNNAYYNSYANYGRTIGNGMVMGPLYNLDGYMAMIGNRVRGVQLSLRGEAGNVEWRLQGNHRRAYGNGFVPLLPARSATSVMAEARLHLRRVDGLSLMLQGAMDRGKLPCNSAALLVGATYSGNLTIGRR